MKYMHQKWAENLLVSFVACMLSMWMANGVARADDPQVPMPPAAGWPSFPQPVARVQVPSTCGTVLHNFGCAQDSKLEKALEQEFWLLVGNLGTSSDPAVAELKNWVGRVANYAGYTSRITGLATPQNRYGGYRSGPQRNYGRLTMLLAAANMALFRVYDIDALVAAAQDGNVIKLIANANQVPALYRVLESLKYADEATYLMPTHQNARAFAYSIGAFLQWALPIKGIEIGKLLPNVRGTLGLRRAYPLGFEGGKASLEALTDLTAPCDDAASCRELAGTEGVVAAALSLQLLAIDAVPTDAWPGLEHFKSLVEVGVDVVHDPLAGDCGTYACAHTSTVAPFKKLGVLMLTATAYGRLGDTAQMREVFAQVRALAAQQQWPFKARVDDLQAHLEGTGPYAGAGLLNQWQAQPNRRLGFVQVPLSPATGVSSCSSCHYAGQMSNPNIYEH